MYLMSPYLEDVYSPHVYKKLVKKTVTKVRKIKRELKFTHIAFRGSSGAAMAFPVSMITGIPLIHVRKLTERSHGYPIEGYGNCEKYIIIDDFICTGKTVKGITNSLKDIECVGIITYNSDTKSEYVITRGRKRIQIPVFAP